MSLGFLMCGFVGFVMMWVCLGLAFVMCGCVCG